MHVSIDEHVPKTVLSDAKRIKQVLVNLISNAIKYTEKGQVNLQLKLELHSDTPRVVFDIEDTGIGMSEEFKGRIFQPYQRDHKARAKIAGNGLGLEISRRIALKLGGDLELLKSSLNNGSSFRFWLDLQAT
jgi:signal transduction histidine kinase